jgi:hypothetical protein
LVADQLQTGLKGAVSKLKLIVGAVPSTLSAWVVPVPSICL